MKDRTRFVRVIVVSMLLALTTWVMSSCAKKESTDTTTTDTTPAPGPTAMTDANIAAVVVAANNADVENGRQADSKSQNAEVKAFAQQMVTDHTSVNGQATALATKLSLTPEDNETSLGLTASQDSLRAARGALTGAAFDKAYVDNEVAYHQNVLDALDQTLIPSAQNAELKQLLTDVRPAFAAHLEHAKQIQAKMGGTANP